jgi:hypothetical protein
MNNLIQLNMNSSRSELSDNSNGLGVRKSRKDRRDRKKTTDAGGKMSVRE